MEVPYENRVVAIMGNLGFDTAVQELEARCKTVLQECGFGPEHFSGVASTRRESGSACEIVFASPQLLLQARIKITAMRKSFQTTSTRFVWLDAKKTRTELKPNRMTHKVNEILETFEGERTEGTQTVSKDLAKKCVKVGTVVMGYSSGQQWKWTAEAAAQP